MNFNEFPDSLREHVKNAEIYQIEPRSGIYILFIDGSPVYVGQTKAELIHRISHHLRTKPARATHYCFIPCAADKLDEMEFLFITELEPDWNKLLPKGSDFVSPSSVSSALRKRGVFISPAKIAKHLMQVNARFKTLKNSVLAWFHKDDISKHYGATS